VTQAPTAPTPDRYHAGYPGVKTACPRGVRTPLPFSLRLMTQNTEHCTACGAEAAYRTVNAGTFDEPNATERVAYRCSNLRCENSDPDYVTFDTFR
jgi:predicted RNA-binding Zn-ribbon protein involved in translation (DUF1610 family)